VIFKSDGAENLGVLSIASSIGLPMAASDANGAIAAAIAVLVKNDLLEFDIVLVFLLSAELMMEFGSLWNASTFQR